MTAPIHKDRGSMESMNPPCSLSRNPEWQAFFRGLFWGEGCLAIRVQRQRRNGKLNTYHRPTIEVSQAQDNRAMLIHLQEVLGGTVYDRKATYGSVGAKQNHSTWMVRDLEKCRLVCDILLQETFYQDKKASQVIALNEFLTLAEAWTQKSRPPEILEQMDALMERANARLKR